MTREHDERRVRRGCLDCVHKDVPAKKEPCASCFQQFYRWKNWEDRKAGDAIRQTKAM